MDLKYLGQSSFKMSFKVGIVVLSDPFDPDHTKLAFSNQKADIVTISSDDKAHNFIKGVTGPAKREDVFLVNEEGEYEVGGVEVTAKKTFKDKNKGKDYGENLIMVIRQNGITICHLGSLGHELSEKQIEVIGSVDVLLLPVGGDSPIGQKEMESMISGMSPSLVIPMYKKQEDLKEFLDKNSLEVMLEGVDKLKINANTLPENTKVVVLSHKN
jgi:L-ascorbate metabolism protein UlaG (beta-lactamase superfamily)